MFPKFSHWCFEKNSLKKTLNENHNAFGLSNEEVNFPNKVITSFSVQCASFFRNIFENKNKFTYLSIIQFLRRLLLGDLFHLDSKTWGISISRGRRFWMFFYCSTNSFVYIENIKDGRIQSEPIGPSSRI